MLGTIRELLGSGSFFGFKLLEGDGILVFILAPGAFMALGYLMVLFNKLKGLMLWNTSSSSYLLSL